jgi:hypothetical protein
MGMLNTSATTMIPAAADYEVLGVEAAGQARAGRPLTAQRPRWPRLVYLFRNQDHSTTLA